MGQLHSPYQMLGAFRRRYLQRGMQHGPVPFRRTRLRKEIATLQPHIRRILPETLR